MPPVRASHPAVSLPPTPGERSVPRDLTVTSPRGADTDGSTERRLQAFGELHEVDELAQRRMPFTALLVVDRAVALGDGQ